MRIASPASRSSGIACLEVRARARVLALRERGERARHERAAAEERRRICARRVASARSTNWRASRNCPSAYQNQYSAPTKRSASSARAASSRRPTPRRARRLSCSATSRASEAGRVRAADEVGRDRLDDAEVVLGEAHARRVALAALRRAARRRTGARSRAADSARRRRPAPSRRATCRRAPATPSRMSSTLERLAGADRLRRVEREAAGEHGRGGAAAPARARRGAEAPLHRRAQRAMARQRRAASRR